MAEQSREHRQGAASFVFGLFLGSYLRGHRRHTRSMAPSPLEGLSAHQAMTVAAIANVIASIVTGALFAYGIYALSLVNAR
jgi:hypothetical protein